MNALQVFMAVCIMNGFGYTAWWHWVVAAVCYLLSVEDWG